MRLVRWLWTWLNRPKRRHGLLLLVLLGGTACVHVGITPDLPFPVAPEVQFHAVSPGTICTTELDANKLATYLEELHAYRQAVHRLHRAP